MLTREFYDDLRDPYEQTRLPTPSRRRENRPDPDLHDLRHPAVRLLYDTRSLYPHEREGHGEVTLPIAVEIDERKKTGTP